MLKNIYIYLFIDDLSSSSSGQTATTKVMQKSLFVRDLTWSMIIVYLLFILNPVMPTVADKIAHTFWKDYHLVVVHGLFGSDHVDRAISKAAKQAENNKTSKSGQDEFAHIISEATFKFSSEYMVLLSYPFYKYHLFLNYPDIDYLPPKA